MGNQRKGVELPFFITIIIALEIVLIKGSLFLTFMPMLIAFYIVPINFVKKHAVGILLALLGFYYKDSQQKLDSDKRNIILSKYTCFLDAVYFIYRYPDCHFLAFNEDQSGKFAYSTVSSFAVFFNIFASLQFFYKKGTKGQSLKEIMDRPYFKNGGKLIAFYDKIHTNKQEILDRQNRLSEDIYKLQRQLIIADIQYPTKRGGLFSKKTSGVFLFLSALGTLIPENVNYRCRIKSELSILKKQNKRLKGELEPLKQQHERLKQQMQPLKQQNKSLKQKIKSLKQYFEPPKQEQATFRQLSICSIGQLQLHSLHNQQKLISNSQQFQIAYSNPKNSNLFVGIGTKQIFGLFGCCADFPKKIKEGVFYSCKGGWIHKCEEQVHLNSILKQGDILTLRVNLSRQRIIFSKNRLIFFQCWIPSNILQKDIYFFVKQGCKQHFS